MLLGDKGVALALPLARGLGAPLIVVNLLARVPHERIHTCRRRAHLV